MTKYTQPYVRKRRVSRHSDNWVWQAIMFATDASGKPRQMTKNTPHDCDAPKQTEKPSRGRRNIPTGRNAKLALDWASQWRDELVAKDATSPANPTTLSVADFVSRYFSSLDVEPGTLEGYQAMLGRIALLDKPITDLTPTDVQHWVTGMQSSGVGRSILRKTFDQPRYACSWGVKIQELSFNPCDAIKRPKRGETMPNPLPTSEVPRLIKALNDMRMFDAQLCDTALFALNTGMRRGEIAALRFIETDDCIHVNHTVAKRKGGGFLKDYPKNGHRRIVSHSDAARQIIEARRALFKSANTYSDNAFVFADPKTPNTFLSLDMISRKFASFAKSHAFIGVEGKIITFHHLRDTFATTALIGGVDIVTVASMLGHRDTATTLRHYAHFLPDHNAEAMQRVSELLNKADAPQTNSDNS